MREEREHGETASADLEIGSTKARQNITWQQEQQLKLLILLEQRSSGQQQYGNYNHCGLCVLLLLANHTTMLPLLPLAN